MPELGALLLRSAWWASLGHHMSLSMYAYISTQCITMSYCQGLPAPGNICPFYIWGKKTQVWKYHWTSHARENIRKDFITIVSWLYKILNTKWGLCDGLFWFVAYLSPWISQMKHWKLLKIAWIFDLVWKLLSSSDCFCFSSCSGSPTRPNWVDAGSLRFVRRTKNRGSKKQQMQLYGFSLGRLRGQPALGSLSQRRYQLNTFFIFSFMKLEYLPTSENLTLGKVVQHFMRKIEVEV